MSIFHPQWFHWLLIRIMMKIVRFCGWWFQNCQVLWLMISKLSGFVVDDCARLPRGGHHLPIHRSSRLHQQHRGKSPLFSFIFCLFFPLWLILSHASLSFYPLSFYTVVHQVRNVLCAIRQNLIFWGDNDSDDHWASLRGLLSICHRLLHQPD